MYTTLDTEQSRKAGKRLVDNCAFLVGNYAFPRIEYAKMSYPFRGHTSFPTTLSTETKIALNCRVLLTFSKQGVSNYFCFDG